MPTAPPHVLEVESALFPDQPLGSAHRAFREPAARLGSMAKVNGISGRVENQFVHPDYVPLAERSDFKLGSGGVLNDPLQRDSGSRRRVFLLRMMPLEDLPEILVLQSGRGTPRNLKKQIHTDREIGRVQQSNPASGVFHHLPDSRQFSIPTRSPNHNAFFCTDASFNVPEHRGRCSEIDDHIDRGQLLRSQGGGLWIVVSAQHIDVMVPLTRHVRNQRSRFTPA